MLTARPDKTAKSVTESVSEWAEAKPRKQAKTALATCGNRLSMGCAAW